jgi:hypothetical protein
MEQSRGIPLRKKRFLLRDSDRDGFTRKNIELFNDNGFLVGGDEIDAPPPSNRLYPDEGGISPGDVRNNPTDYSVQTHETLQVLQNTSTINLNHQVDNAGQYTTIKSTVYVAGSNDLVMLISNPQISNSNDRDILTVQGAGSSVVLQNGNGLRLYTKYLKLDSGFMVTLIYNSTDGLWCETSRMTSTTFALNGEF